MNLVNFEVERPFNRVEVRLNGNDNDCFFIDCICVIIYKIRKKESANNYFYGCSELVYSFVFRVWQYWTICLT